MNEGNSRDAGAAAQDRRDPFADDVLARLIRSNPDYQREHGHYIVPLAERLLAARFENERLRGLAADVIGDLNDTCDCDSHVAAVAAYRRRLDA